MKKLNIFFIGLLMISFSCNLETFYQVDDPLAESITEFVVDANSDDYMDIYSFNYYAPLQFVWNAAQSGLGTKLTYTWQLDEFEGDFSNPIGSVETSNTKLIIPTGEFLAMLNNAGITPAGEVKLAWRVKASLTNNEKFTNQFNFTANIISIADFSESVEEIYIYGDATSGGLSLEDATALKSNGDGTFSAMVELKNANDGGTGFYILASKEYYHPVWGGASATGGTLLTYSASGENPDMIPAPADSYLYIVEVDFINATYTVTKFAPPTTLYLVGSGCAADWAPENSIAMTDKGSGKFELIADLTAGEIKFIEDQTWDHPWGKGAADGKLTNVGGGSNIAVPSAGSYLIKVDFNTLSYRLIKGPANLYLVGGDCPIGWTETNALAFNNFNNGTFEIYANLTTGNGGIKFLESRSWTGDWGEDPANPGYIIQEGEQNVAVTQAAYSRVFVDFTTGMYTITPTSWAVTGSATPNGWPDPALDHDMTYDSGTNSWSVTLNLTAGEIKFRANNGWDLNFGDDGANGSLEPGGTNIAVSTAGNYTITMTLGYGGAYTYSLTLNP